MKSQEEEKEPLRDIKIVQKTEQTIKEEDEKTDPLLEQSMQSRQTLNKVNATFRESTDLETL